MWSQSAQVSPASVSIKSQLIINFLLSGNYLKTNRAWLGDLNARDPPARTDGLVVTGGEGGRAEELPGPTPVRPDLPGRG